MNAGPGESTPGPVSILVLGSVNLDIVAHAPRLPQAGETVSGARLERYPGGKGANQALAAQRLGAAVSLVARVGMDQEADDALALLRAEGVDLQHCVAVDELHTGTALIVVAESAENQIVVAPGANRALRPETLVLPRADALICQLEVPLDTLAQAVRDFAGFVCINLAPAQVLPREVTDRADLLVVNETEAATLAASLAGHPGLVATTYGARGASLSRAGRLEAQVEAPRVNAIDSTGAGDCFTAALTLRLLAGDSTTAALAFACAAGAAAATRDGAQPSFPTDAEVRSLLQER